MLLLYVLIKKNAADGNKALNAARYNILGALHLREGGGAKHSPPGDRCGKCR